MDATTVALVIVLIIVAIFVVKPRRFEHFDMIDDGGSMHFSHPFDILSPNNFRS